MVTPLMVKKSVFLKKQPGSRDKSAHFVIPHYAGIVNYNLTDWLTKNKDPVVDQLKNLLKFRKFVKIHCSVYKI